LRRLRAATAILHSGFEGGTGGNDGLSGLAETSCDFLHWVVHHKLASNDKPRRGLDVVTETARQVDELDIFTLNHDILIEDQCRSQEIALEEGFQHRRGEVRAFSGWPDQRVEKVRLFKLHGSLNWFCYDFPGRVRQFAIPDGDASHSRDQNGQLLRIVGTKAAFLSGTIVKEQPYGIGFFGDVFAAFRRHVAVHKHLVFCGYGFGDPGVNSRVYQWTCDNLDGSNRIVVLTEQSPTDFFADKPYWLETLYDQKRLILVSKWLQNCSVEDLLPYFDR
jgi:hypothetical protein